MLKKPEHILTFIQHALSHPAPAVEQAARRPVVGDLGINTSSGAGDDDDGDSDDDTPGSERYSREDEIAETAVNLLLAILEGGLHSTWLT